MQPGNSECSNVVFSCKCQQQPETIYGLGSLHPLLGPSSGALSGMGEKTCKLPLCSFPELTGTQKNKCTQKKKGTYNYLLNNSHIYTYIHTHILYIYINTYITGLQAHPCPPGDGSMQPRPRRVPGPPGPTAYLALLNIFVFCIIFWGFGEYVLFLLSMLLLLFDIGMYPHPIYSPPWAPRRRLPIAVRAAPCLFIVICLCLLRFLFVFLFNFLFMFLFLFNVISICLLLSPYLSFVRGSSSTWFTSTWALSTHCEGEH